MTLCVLLAASIVGVLLPIAAGVSVLEAVYLALLSGLRSAQAGIEACAQENAFFEPSICG